MIVNHCVPQNFTGTYRDLCNSVEQRQVLIALKRVLVSLDSKVWLIRRYFYAETVGILSPNEMSLLYSVWPIA